VLREGLGGEVLKVRDGRAVEHGSNKKRSGFFVSGHYCIIS
jgi:hypothetical protein